MPPVSTDAPLSVVDEFTRECVLPAGERGMTSEGSVDRLIEAYSARGVPTHIRSDNGGEFIARAGRHSRFLEPHVLVSASRASTMRASLAYSASIPSPASPTCTS